MRVGSITGGLKVLGVEPGGNYPGIATKMGSSPQAAHA